MVVYLLFIIALSFDAFITALTYEGDNIKIPILSNLIISIICSFSLIISLFFGNYLDTIVSETVLKHISFIILFCLGITKIFGDIIKNRLIKKKTNNYLFNCIVKNGQDYKKTSCDKSNLLSTRSALLLSVVLSFDSLSSGIAFSLNYNYFIIVFLFSFFVNFLLILCSKIFKGIKIDFSFFGGLIFILIAFSKL